MNAGGASTAVIALYALVCLLGMCLFFFAVLLLVQIRRSRLRQKREADSKAVREALHQALVQFLTGSPDDSAIRKHLKAHRQDVADMLLHFQSTVSGGARDRLCHLALDLGLVHEWCEDGASPDRMRRRKGLSRLAFICNYEPCRRVAGELMTRALEDPDGEVRLSAARGLVKTGVTVDVEDVFLLALDPNRFTRAVLTEELRGHAMLLLTEGIPEVLDSGQKPYVRATLEILTAWERAIPLEHLHRFLNGIDREIRVMALRLAPLCPPDDATRRAIARALADEDEEVRSLADAAAVRLNLPRGGVSV
jgi:HEAT repeat protein